MLCAAGAITTGKHGRRLDELAVELQKAGGTALVVEADITDRAQAEAAVE